MAFLGVALAIWTYFSILLVVPAESTYVVLTNLETLQPAASTTNFTNTTGSVDILRSFGIPTSRNTSDAAAGQNTATSSHASSHIPSPKRRPNPFLQRLPSAAETASNSMYPPESMFTAQHQKTAEQAQFVAPNAAAEQYTIQHNSQGSPLSENSAFNPSRSVLNKPPTKAGPVIQEAGPGGFPSMSGVPSRPTATSIFSSVQQLQQNPEPLRYPNIQQHPQQTSNTGPSFGASNPSQPLFPNQAVDARPHFTTHGHQHHHHQQQFPYEQSLQSSNKFSGMTIHSPAGSVHNPGFNDPNGKTADPFSPPFDPNFPSHQGAYPSQAQPGSFPAPQQQPSPYQQQPPQGTYPGQQPPPQAAYPVPPAPGAYPGSQSPPAAYPVQQLTPGAYPGQPQTQGTYPRPQPPQGQPPSAAVYPGAYPGQQPPPGPYPPQSQQPPQGVYSQQPQPQPNYQPPPTQLPYQSQPAPYPGYADPNAAPSYPQSGQYNTGQAPPTYPPEASGPIPRMPGGAQPPSYHQHAQNPTHLHQIAQYQQPQPQSQQNQPTTTPAPVTWNPNPIPGVDYSAIFAGVPASQLPGGQPPLAAPLPSQMPPMGLPPPPPGYPMYPPAHVHGMHPNMYGSMPMHNTAYHPNLPMISPTADTTTAAPTTTPAPTPAGEIEIEGPVTTPPPPSSTTPNATAMLNSTYIQKSGPHATLHQGGALYPLQTNVPVPTTTAAGEIEFEMEGTTPPPTTFMPPSLRTEAPYYPILGTGQLKNPNPKPAPPRRLYLTKENYARYIQRQKIEKAQKQQRDLQLKKQQRLLQQQQQQQQTQQQRFRQMQLQRQQQQMIMRQHFHHHGPYHQQQAPGQNNWFPAQPGYPPQQQQPYPSQYPQQQYPPQQPPMYPQQQQQVAYGQPAVQPYQPSPQGVAYQQPPGTYPQAPQQGAFVTAQQPNAYPQPTQQPTAYPPQVQQGGYQQPPGAYPQPQQPSGYPGYQQQQQLPPGYPQPASYPMSQQPQPQTAPYGQYPQQAPAQSQSNQPPPIPPQNIDDPNKAQLQKLLLQIQQAKSRTQAKNLSPESRRQWEAIFRKLYQIYQRYKAEQKTAATATG